MTTPRADRLFTRVMPGPHYIRLPIGSQ